MTTTAFSLPSPLSLGTVELGMDYGFRGSSHRGKPSEQEARSVLHRACELGIRLLDTAPSYGDSEQIIGRALAGSAHPPQLATKVALSPQMPRQQYGTAVRRSLESSLLALQVECIDLLQLHNTSAQLLDSDELLAALQDLEQQGKVRALGASCGDAQVALLALDHGLFSCLQLPFNALDRRMLPHVLPRARQQGVAILARSAFLRGLLIDHAQVPTPLLALSPSIAALQQIAHSAGIATLSELALRFCLSFNAIGSVLIGVRSLAELEANVSQSSAGPLPQPVVEAICALPPQAPAMIDPTHWQAII